ncbi:MFS transporter [Streptomyces sp. SCSIO 30461]|uniref:MDR family MFS transporter n=1 Tax=Streptomyces sp. SCSIO 30461 TaxID=3118085 RepID=UPI00387ECE80
MHRLSVRFEIVMVQLVAVLAALDQTSVSTALPTIVDDLGAVADLPWVVTGSLLAVTVAGPFWGKLGDMYGRVRVLQFSLVVFLMGSFLCGAARGMSELIVFRLLQGVGSGGLLVLSLALIGDLVEPRDRGRYQGMVSGLYAAASGVGPLLGGALAQYTSWRWLFYVNGLVSAAALGALLVTLRSGKSRRIAHTIDYAGSLALAALTSLVVLAISLSADASAGRWKAWQVMMLVVIVALLVALFVSVERRAAEPVMPLGLFSNPVFSLMALMAFLIGVARSAATTYLPVFLQFIRDVGPLGAGLYLLPTIVGYTTGAVVSGKLVTRTGRCKPYLIMGTALITIGSLGIHQFTTRTGDPWLICAFLLLGLGIGMTLPVLVLAAENAVDYSQIGVTIAGVTYFRSAGQVIGVAAVGAVFTIRLGTHIAETGIAQQDIPSGFDPATIRDNPALLHSYTMSITEAFLGAVLLGAVVFICSWLLKEQPVKPAVTVPDVSQTLGSAPVERTSLEEIERSLSVLGSRQAQRSLHQRIAQASGLGLAPTACWLLLRSSQRAHVEPSSLAAGGVVTGDAIEAAVEQLCDRRLAVMENDLLVLTDKGRDTAVELAHACRQALAELLGDWDPEQYADLARLLTDLSERLLGDEPP